MKTNDDRQQQIKEAYFTISSPCEPSAQVSLKNIISSRINNKIFQPCHGMFQNDELGQSSSKTKRNLAVSTTYLIPSANYRSEKDPIKALGRIDFTKYALSTIIYLMQSSENG